LGSSPRVFGGLLFLLVFIFLYNEVSVEQFLERRTMDNERHEYILQNTTTNLQLPSPVRLILHIPFIISGLVQVGNYARGDRTYELTREFGTSLITQAPNSIIYRPLSGNLPRKMIYLMQHVGAVLDNLTFLQFIPEGYAFRVLNNSNANPLGLFPKFSRKNLFGAHFIDPTSPGSIRESVSTFARYMIEDEDPTVYCIWPSGKLWDSKLENGIKEFKAGAFYMSAYSGIPVSIVHTKFTGLVKKMIVEQTPLVYPPSLDPIERDYNSFYDNVSHKESVNGFRDKIEAMYRAVDGKLSVEI